MIETRIDKQTGHSTIVLRPNNSATWKFNMQVVGSLALIGFIISTYFALKGMWLIYPFAGLEIGLLFACLYIRLRANINTEVITFDDDTVSVERGSYHAEKSWTYHRLWAKVFVREPSLRGRPKKIFIRSHGKELELGSFLNKQDKELLIKDLKHIIYT